MRREILKLGAGLANALASGGGNRTIASAELGFEITFGDSWEIENKLAEVGVIVAVNKSNELRKVAIFTLAVHALPGVAIKDMTRQGMDDYFARETVGWETVDKTELRLSGLDACKITLKKTDQESKVVSHSSFYVLMAGNRMYMMTAPQLEDDDKTAKEIEAIVASFKIIETK